jgi:transposase
MNTTTYGLDLAKRIFQVHWVEHDSGEVKRKKLARGEVVGFFARCPAGVVAMEACGSAHYWARTMRRYGHEVKLVAAQFVRPYVKTNKTDVADAEAIWEASQRPGMREVAVKSEGQQAVLGVHRVREQLVKQRTAQANQIRGLLYEFGVIAPQGWRRLVVQAGGLLADESRCAVPGLLREVLQEQVEAIRGLTQRIAALERRIEGWRRGSNECERIAAIPGIGRLSATALVATIGEAKSFRSGRELAAYLGLVPRQSGSGGRVRLLGISKRGDPYLRTLLIHGARTVLNSQSRPGRELDPWLKQLLMRRPKNVVIVALANKMVRTVWALLAHGRTYQRDWAGSMPRPV